MAGNAWRFASVFAWISVLLLLLHCNVKTGGQGRCTASKECWEHEQCVNQICILRAGTEKVQAKEPLPDVWDASAGSESQPTHELGEQVSADKVFREVISEKHTDEVFPENTRVTPKIVSMSPEGASPDMSPLWVELHGEGFLPESEVLFGSLSPKVLYYSKSLLQFYIEPGKTPTSFYKVVVRNPGGLLSNSVAFMLIWDYHWRPHLTVLNPNKATTGTKVVFSVHGTGFTSGATLVFDGKTVSSKRIRRDEVRAEPHLDLTHVSPGTYNVWVQLTDGTKTNALEFVVSSLYSTPRLGRILPFTVLLGTSTQLAIYGDDFHPQSKFYIGSKEFKAPQLKFHSASYMTINVDTRVGNWARRDYDAYVLNPKYKKSSVFKLSVVHSIPTVRSLKPIGWNESCATDIEIEGENFKSISSVYLGSLHFTQTSTTHQLTLVGTHKLKFRLGKKGLAPGVHKLLVENQPKVTSGKLLFHVLPTSRLSSPQALTFLPAGGFSGSFVSVHILPLPQTSFHPGTVVELDGQSTATTCYFDGKGVCRSLKANLDLRSVKPGDHNVRLVSPCGRKSEEFPFFVAALPVPSIVLHKLNTNRQSQGISSAQLVVLGKGFCTRNKQNSCVQEPKILVTNDKGDDRSSHFTVKSVRLYSYQDLLLVSFNPKSLKVGLYRVRLQHADGTKSNAMPLTIKP